MQMILIHILSHSALNSHTSFLEVGPKFHNRDFKHSADNFTRIHKLNIFIMRVMNNTFLFNLLLINSVHNKGNDKFSMLN